MSDCDSTMKIFENFETTKKWQMTNEIFRNKKKWQMKFCRNEIVVVEKKSFVLSRRVVKRILSTQSIANETRALRDAMWTRDKCVEKRCKKKKRNRTKNDANVTTFDFFESKWFIAQTFDVEIDRQLKTYDLIDHHENEMNCKFFESSTIMRYI